MLLYTPNMMILYHSYYNNNPTLLELDMDRIDENQDPKGILADDVLPDGTVLKKGGLVTYVPYSAGRMTELWGEDANEFRPERWLKEGVFIPVSPFKFSAFQVNCMTFGAHSPSYCLDNVLKKSSKQFLQ